MPCKAMQGKVRQSKAKESKEKDLTGYIMKIGEKITLLRQLSGMSQEQFADALSVSRQSVSKWEMNQSMPQLDKVLQISDLFHVSLDELLRDEIALTPENTQSADAPQAAVRRKYFGTDGFRGEANVGLTSDQAYKVGRFLGWYYASPLSGCQKEGYRPKIVIGKDTRRSSYMLEYSLVAGITSSGADAYMLHVTTTPSVSYVTRKDGFDCGIMITASHNPYMDNGIKVISGSGEKLDDQTTAYVEAYLDGDMALLGLADDAFPAGAKPDLPLATKENIGAIIDYASGRNRYVGYLISLAASSYKDLRIGLDCANGASWALGKAVFEALGAKVTVIGNTPNGLNINKDCGSTHIEALQKLVRENNLDVGFAFDGDADRCIAVDEHGNVVDGDRIMYILARRMKKNKTLKKNTIVVTTMSNSGFLKSLKELGIKAKITDVGDRFVFEEMQKNGYMLGGEQSGHIILKKYATTGDALLTAIMLTEEICQEKLSLSHLAKDVMIYPQKLKNVRVTDKAAALAAPALREEAAKVTKEIAGNGRVLLRQSGTEPVIRLMVECNDEAKLNEYIDKLYEAVKKGGYCCE